MTGPTLTTTERGRQGGSFARISVRTRITAVIALLSTAAMAGAGILVYTLESARIERQTSEQIDQEIAEFRRLQGGDDPETGEAFTDVGRLLDLFLRRNVPDDDEILLAYTDAADEPSRTVNRNAEEFLTEPGYEAAVTELFDEGGTEVLASDAFGEVWVTVLPVVNETTQGSLVIVSFLADEHDEINQTMQTYAIVALLSLGLLVLLASTQSGRLLAPLRTLRETASDITATDLSRRIPEQGNDDITALTRTFNVMLDRLEGGFVTQRQFLDDAGHELKTPLTVLRGHLELLDASSPEDVDETRALLLEEVDRMARLVGDLILLAKTSRPDFVTTGPTDVAALTETTLSKARALGERTWVLDATAEVRADLDEQRVTQALLQLCDNAVKHTGPGDTVALGSSYDEGRVRLWVRDTGPGVPVADREQIFERFGRSVVPDGDEGFGLGLSIVRAIALAHGGSVCVEEAEPPGARFVLSLPARTDASGPVTTTQTMEVPLWPGS
ncbi:ATP-binding protein [Nocardioides sp.]|uniref:sensor histidine kinase n=1 Tax=Nocardioides sp. TaxID=35761 RepID=UPI00286A6101|nr:ATP-binding protein [Nocardioides sp.]